jgi:histidine triad (HIT) family protein
VNIIQNNGASAGQLVFHAHVHVIPRFAEDGILKLPGGKEMIQKDEALAMLSKIQDKL